MRRNIRSALSRGLKTVHKCSAHDLTLSIAGGGPSLRDTYREMTGRIAAVNGSHDWLISQGVIPYACALIDPLPELAERITPRDDVVYFVGSCCDPAVLERLKGKHVFLWHVAGQLDDEQEIIEEATKDWFLIGGGSTVSLRWISLGYVLGFRKFALHGFDSSLRGNEHHAYEHDEGQRPGTLMVGGFETLPAWLAQIDDFNRMLDRLAKPDMEPCSFEVYGDGLFQSCWRKMK